MVAVLYAPAHQRDPDYGLVVAQRPGQLIAEPVSEYGVPRNTFTGFNTDKDRNDADIVTMSSPIRRHPG